MHQRTFCMWRSAPSSTVPWYPPLTIRKGCQLIRKLKVCAWLTCESKMKHTCSSSRLECIVFVLYSPYSEEVRVRNHNSSMMINKSTGMWSLQEMRISGGTENKEDCSPMESGKSGCRIPRCIRITFDSLIVHSSRMYHHKLSRVPLAPKVKYFFVADAHSLVAFMIAGDGDGDGRPKSFKSSQSINVSQSILTFLPSLECDLVRFCRLFLSIRAWMWYLKCHKRRWYLD